MNRSAHISGDGRYRYWLRRQWGDPDGPLAVFVMLNPSTADAEVDDATIRRCIRFAQRERCDGLHVVNLFAYRATNPDHLRIADPVGPLNDMAIRSAFMLPGVVVAAWGAHPLAEPRGRRVLTLAREVGRPLSCLGVTRSGAPRHPLYVRGDSPLVDWRVLS